MTRAAINLTLPYPPSANRYWRHYRGVTVCSTEAKAYKKEVALLARAAGLMTPISGRVAVSVVLYPRRPKDWARRAAKDPLWDDSVACIDLDNALKVLIDALNGTVIEDDRWIRQIVAERAVPDGEARVEVMVSAC